MLGGWRGREREGGLTVGVEGGWEEGEGEEEEKEEHFGR